MVFVADEISLALAHVVEFFNAQMDPAEVLAVEVEQFANDTVQTMVPRVIGQTAEAESKKTVATAQRRWDESSFFRGWPATEESTRLPSAAKSSSGPSNMILRRRGVKAPRIVRPIYGLNSAIHLFSGFRARNHHLMMRTSD
jgi:hypothetical protein